MTDGSIRFLAGLSLAALAAITGIVSYLHALTVVYIAGSAGLVAYLVPFVADLMIVTASLAILDAIRHHAPKPPLAMVSLVAGIGSTLAMNIVAGLHISAGGALVAALPPVAFVLSLETLMGIVRLARAGDGASHLTATGGQCPHQVAMSAEDAIVTAYLHARDCLGEPVSQRQLSATFGVPRPKVATLVGTLNGTRPNDAEEDVTKRVSLTHQQPTAGHPRYVVVGLNRRRVLAGAAPGGGLLLSAPDRQSARPRRVLAHDHPDRGRSHRITGTGRCGMTAGDLDLSRAAWRTSIYSNNGGNCIEITTCARHSSGARLDRPRRPGPGLHAGTVMGTLRGSGCAVTACCSSRGCVLASRSGARSGGWL